MNLTNGGVMETTSELAYLLPPPWVSLESAPRVLTFAAPAVADLF